MYWIVWDLSNDVNGMESGMENILVWAGIELGFIIGASVGLWFFAEKSAGNTGMCLLQLSRADAGSGPFLKQLTPKGYPRPYGIILST